MGHITLPIIIGLTALPLFILGLFIRKGKGLMLIAGYNTMSEEDRNAVDKEKLSRIVGNLLIRMAVETILLGVTIYFKMTWAAIALIIVTIADPCIVAFLTSQDESINVSSKVSSGKGQKGRKTAGTIITVIVLVGLGFMFFYGEGEPAVHIRENGIQIEGLYGREVSFSDIKEITLIEQSMKEIGTGHRYNGYGGFGDSLKGNFRSEDRGNYLLFVKAESPFTIWIDCYTDKDIYISYRDSEETKALYQKLITAVP